MVKKRNGELLLKGYRISVLDMDGDNGSTTTCIYLIPLNCTLKMIKMMNFMLCVFHQFFFQNLIVQLSSFSDPQVRSTYPLEISYDSTLQEIYISSHFHFTSSLGRDTIHIFAQTRKLTINCDTFSSFLIPTTKQVLKSWFFSTFIISLKSHTSFYLMIQYLVQVTITLYQGYHMNF